MKLTSLSVALMALFAALYYVLSIFTPYIPAIGIPDIKISLEALIATIFGLILGPFLGAITAFTGAFIAWLLPPGSPSPTGVPFLLSPPINALVAGLIYYKKWKAAFATLAVLIIAFMFMPPSQPFPENFHVGLAVVWDKIIALLLIIPTILIARRKLSKRQAAGLAGIATMVLALCALYAAFEPGLLQLTITLTFALLVATILFIITLSTVYSGFFSKAAVTAGLLYFLIAFIGNQADSMWGSLIFSVPVVYEGVFNIQVEVVRWLFLLSPFIYPVIRLIQSAIATTIAIPLMKAVKKLGLSLEEYTIESK